MTQGVTSSPFLTPIPSPQEAPFNPALLVPQPQHIDILPRAYPAHVHKECAIVSNVQSAKIRSYFREKLKEKGLKALDGNESSKFDIHIDLNPNVSDKPQGYKLTVYADKIEIVGHDEDGLFYGINTLLEMLEICQKDEDGFCVLPQMEISDWPDFPHRGVLLDISRDRVPTLETLKGLVDKLAKWKINQLQLYMEHTFAYKGHEKVWKEASPLTKEDIQELNAYCKSRFVELVPNQNSMAHMHRWLMHKDYRKYAESPSAVQNKDFKKEHYQNEGNPGYSLCPTNPETLRLVNGLYDQLLPNFSSKQVNVGLDEPHDLARGGEKSRATTQKEGASKVYLDYLNQIRRLVKEHGLDRMQFWADFILLDNEILNQLPQDVIPMVWGYEDGFPFELGKKFKDKNIEWYVCPSTNTWNSIGGRTDDGIHNLTQAAVKGKENQASGYLITEWGDNGHHHPLSVSYLPLLLGASLSWKVMPQEAVDKMEIPHLLDLHVFKDTSGQMGSLAYEVGNLYRLAVQEKSRLTGSSALLRLLVFNEEYPDPEIMKNLNPKGLVMIRERLAEAKNRLKTVKMECPESTIIGKEYALIIDLLDFSCQFGLALLQYPEIKRIPKLPKEIRSQLKKEIQPLFKRYEDVWLLRDRKGGLEDSLRRLKHLQELL